MDSRQISIETEPSFADFFRPIVERTIRVRPLFGLLFILFIAPMALLSIYLSWGRAEFIYIVVALATVLALLLYLFFMIYLSAKQSASKSKSKICWIFSEKGYEVSSEFGSADIAWAGIEEILETRHAFLLVFQKPMFFVVPKRFFHAAQIVAFRSLLLENFRGKLDLM